MLKKRVSTLHKITLPQDSITTSLNWLFNIRKKDEWVSGWRGGIEKEVLIGATGLEGIVISKWWVAILIAPGVAFADV